MKLRDCSSKECSCEDYTPGMAKISGPIVLHQMRTGKPLPDDYFIPWRFCPWCGRALTPDSDTHPADP
jgi:hypothetical protein